MRASGFGVQSSGPALHDDARSFPGGGSGITWGELVGLNGAKALKLLAVLALAGPIETP